MKRQEKIQIKHDKVNRYLKEKNLDGVLLSSVANFSWFTGGADTHVEINNKFGVAKLWKHLQFRD